MSSANTAFINLLLVPSRFVRRLQQETTPHAENEVLVPSITRAFTGVLTVTGRLASVPSTLTAASKLSSLKVRQSCDAHLKAWMLTWLVPFWSFSLFRFLGAVADRDDW